MKTDEIATTKHGKTGKNNEKRQRNREQTTKRGPDNCSSTPSQKNNKFLDCSGTPPVTRPVGRLAGRPAGRPAETMKTATNTERKTTKRDGPAGPPDR